MAALLRLSPFFYPSSNVAGKRLPSSKPYVPSIFSPSFPHLLPKPSISNTSRPSLSTDVPISGGGTTGGSSSSGGGGGGRSGGRDGWDAGNHHENDDSSFTVGPLSLLLRGWRSRVSADPQFPFKVFMEELVGVSACVLGDMASRPNFGLNELDFVFSTLVVGSILNFLLMYLLAPTAGGSSGAASSLASSLPSHMFAPGPYSSLLRVGAFAYKGATFAAVGFAAGLVGTAISNGLIALRRRVDPSFEQPNKPPPTLLNALTWAIQLGVSSNLRYQTLNGLEFLMARALPPTGFKLSVVTLRCLNNVLGGMSFVVLARMTGSQKVEEKVELKDK